MGVFVKTGCTNISGPNNNRQRTEATAIGRRENWILHAYCDHVRSHRYWWVSFQRSFTFNSVRVAFNKELMSLMRQLGAHHFVDPGWNLLPDVLCVSQQTGVCYEAPEIFLSRTKRSHYEAQDSCQ